jgi:hypothetical protein
VAEDPVGAGVLEVDAVGVLGGTLTDQGAEAAGRRRVGVAVVLHPATLTPDPMHSRQEPVTSPSAGRTGSSERWALSGSGSASASAVGSVGAATATAR